MIRLLGPRLGVSAALLLGLAILEESVGETFPILVGLVLFVLPAVGLVTTYFFARRSSERPDIVTLRIRAQDALSGLIVKVTGAYLGVLVVARALGIIDPVDRRIFLVGLTFSLLMAAAPDVNALYTWRPWRADDVAREERRRRAEAELAGVSSDPASEGAEGEA